jgi:hypothetical protein
VLSPEEAAGVNALEPNLEREAAFERTYGTVRRMKASKGNPMSGIGMKQARQTVGGAKRREGEKP